MSIKRHWNVLGVPSALTESDQACSADDQLAELTLCLNWTFLSMPYMEADSLTYLMISGPSAMAFSSVHGRHGKPKVYRSESERIPGYLNKSQVPPIASRPSRIVKLSSGFWVCRR